MRRSFAVAGIVIASGFGAAAFLLSRFGTPELTVASEKPYQAKEAVPLVLQDKTLYRQEREHIIPDQSKYYGVFRHLENGSSVSFDANLYKGPWRFTMKTDEATKFSVMWILGNGPRKNAFPSGRRAGLYQATTLGLTSQEANEYFGGRPRHHGVVVIGAGEIIQLSAFGPPEAEPRPPNRFRWPKWIDDPAWTHHLELIVREGLARTASRRLNVIGDLGRTDQGWTYVKLEAAARFAGYGVKIEERGLKATLTKGGETRVIWAGEPMVKGEKGDVVMLKDGALWVPEFWESAGTK